MQLSSPSCHFGSRQKKCFFFLLVSRGLDTAQRVDCYANSERVVRSVAWGRQQFLTRKPARPQPKKSSPQPTQNPVLRSRPVRSSPETFSEAARARVTALEAAISALGSADEVALKSLQEAFQKAKQFAHVPPVGEAIGFMHPISRACQETPRQSR